MPFDEERLKADEIGEFLVGRPTYAFDPASLKRVATVIYDPNGTCRFWLEDGSKDAGLWGLVGDTYWTRYDAFRNGSKNVFYLKWVGPDVAQAYYEDGKPAFLQSRLKELDGLKDAHI